MVNYSKARKLADKINKMVNDFDCSQIECQTEKTVCPLYEICGSV
jgi:hypothetical protein